MLIAREIKAEAIRQGIKLKDLASATGFNPERFSRAIRGEREFRSNELQTIAHALGVQASELMRRAEESGQKAARHDGGESA